MDTSKIKVLSAKLTTEAGKDISRDDAIEYAKQELAEAVDLFELTPTSAEVRLYTEGAEHDPVQKVDFKLSLPGAAINQSAHSRQITKAIDKAMPDLKRQLKRYKNKKVDKSRKASRGAKRHEEERAEREILSDDE